MRYHVLACDYDGTLAWDGVVDPPTLASLEKLRRSGRKLVLVTGRELDDLFRVFPQMDIFDRVVAENGALLYDPSTREETVLCEPPAPEFVKGLRARGVSPISVGRVIVATWEPHEAVVLEVIRQLGLELQIIFNKGAVMVLPSSVNKATGLTAVLGAMGFSPHNTVGIGDAENDHAFMSLCECGVAVSNALPLIKERADLVMQRNHGAGVSELIDLLVANDLSASPPARQKLIVATARNGEEVKVDSYGQVIMIAGSSGGGKSALAGGLLERLKDRGYQFCIIDPEGFLAFPVRLPLRSWRRPCCYQS